MFDNAIKILKYYICYSNGKGIHGCKNNDENIQWSVHTALQVWMHQNSRPIIWIHTVLIISFNNKHERLLLLTTSITKLKTIKFI